MSIKGRQVAGVTTLVVFIVAVLSAYHLATLARLSLQESAAARRAAPAGDLSSARSKCRSATDPYKALREDGGIRSILSRASASPRTSLYAAIVNNDGVAVVHAFPTEEGKVIPELEDLDDRPRSQSRSGSCAIVNSDRTFEMRQPLLLGDQSVRRRSGSASRRSW